MSENLFSQQTVKVAVEADTSGFDRALDELQKRSGGFGTALTSALKGAVITGKSLEDVLRGLAGSLAGMALNAGMQPLQGMASSFLSGFTGMLGGLSPVKPFAKGGVVASPTYFGLGGGGGLGLAGEAGAEAILPLARGADGRLGVASAGGNSGRPVQVNFHMTSPDAASFTKSEAQLSAMLARAVRRGAQRL